MKLIYTALLLVIVSMPARAYLDAGTGSYMLQMSLAGVMALVFTLKMFWQRIKDAFGRGFGIHHRS